MNTSVHIAGSISRAVYNIDIGGWRENGPSIAWEPRLAKWSWLDLVLYSLLHRHASLFCVALNLFGGSLVVTVIPSIFLSIAWEPRLVLDGDLLLPAVIHLILANNQLERGVSGTY